MTRTLPELPDDDSTRTFARLLAWHLNNGTRPRRTPETPGARWTNEEFGTACGGSNEKTVRLWRSGSSVPNDLPTIERELFGDNSAYLVWRQELRNAYDAAKRNRDVVAHAFGTLGSPSAPARRSQSAPTERTSQMSAYDPREQWILLGSRGVLALMELRLHPPRLGNELDTFYLDATLLSGTAEYDYEDRLIVLGVRSAVLVLDSASYQAAQGSMIGERPGPAYFKRLAGGVEITGPRDDNGRLSGDILQGEYIAVIESVGNDEHPLTVSILAGRRSFSVAALGRKKGTVSDDETNVNKDAILNALIYKVQTIDSQGRIVLAEARITRRKPK